jgi:hypothetical protein
MQHPKTQKAISHLRYSITKSPACQAPEMMFREKLLFDTRPQTVDNSGKCVYNYEKPFHGFLRGGAFATGSFECKPVRGGAGE